MEVQLSKNDRIVLTYVDPTPSDVQPPSGCLEAVMAYLDIDDCYVVLWKRAEDAMWNLMWRGDWKSCARYFEEWLNDVFVDSMSEIHEAERAVTGNSGGLPLHSGNTAGV